MKMYVSIANKIYEINRSRNVRVIYTGPENMTIDAVDCHYRNQILYFTDAEAHKVECERLTLERVLSMHERVVRRSSLSRCRHHRAVRR